MKRDLYIYTLRKMRDLFGQEHMDTQVEALEAAIQTLDAIGKKGIFIPGITVEMFRSASLEGVENLMLEGDIQDVIMPVTPYEIKRCSKCDRAQKSIENGQMCWSCDFMTPVILCSKEKWRGQCQE